jgi:hypothetical protein
MVMITSIKEVHNMPDIIELQNQVVDLTEKVEDLTKIINALKIDEQRYLIANKSIAPGIATKIAYDSNGLVLNGDKLVASDIPELEIDAIKNLRSELNDRMKSSDIDRVKKELAAGIVKCTNNIDKTGCKVNVDENGFVVSLSDLLEDDIPALHTSKIEGLDDTIDRILSSIQPTQSSSSSDDNYTISPGVGCKILYDNKGRVISSTELTLDDIPAVIMTEINTIKSSIPSLASQVTVDTIVNNLSKKLDRNEPITPGTYTKLTVDSKGLIKYGEYLSKSDLPELSIDDITELTETLRNKADVNDVISLNESVDSIIGKLSKIDNINSITTDIESRATKKEVVDIRNTVDEIKLLMDNVIDKIPSDMITQTLNDINVELSNLDGRISVIESKLSISE